METTEYIQFTEGQRVKGRYCGGEFTGTVDHIEHHTINANVRRIMVRLDSSTITINGTPCNRSEVMMCVGPDGRERNEDWQQDWLAAA